jgi:molybdenum cofactor cytidylyltransferase
MSRVAIVILAAGGSSRMGSPKQLLPWQGKSLLVRACQEAIEAQCGPVVVVLGAHADRMRPHISSLNVNAVVNDDWTSGMGTSIRLGIRSITSALPVDAAILCVCDQPHVTAGVYQTLIKAFRASHMPIVASKYADAIGTPALFSATLMPQLLALKDDEGGKSILTRLAHDVLAVPFPLGAADIDTPEDYERLMKSE